MKRRLKKLGMLSLSTGILAGGILPVVGHASESNFKQNPVIQQENLNNKIQISNVQYEQEKMINTVSSYIYLNSDGTIGVSSEIPNNIVEKYNINGLKVRFNLLNRQVRDGQIIINNDFSITEKKSLTQLKSSEYEKTKRYWWGDKNWYNNAQTKAHINDLDSASIAAGGTGLALGILGFVPGAFTGAVASTYWKLLGSRMHAHNRGKGVTLSVTWVLIFSVGTR